MERASLKWRNLDGNRSLFSHESEKNEIPQSLSPSLLPFVVSCDEVLGNEVKVVLQNLAGSLAKKSGKSYSETSNFMKSVKDEHCNCTRGQCYKSLQEASPRNKENPVPKLQTSRSPG